VTRQCDRLVAGIVTHGRPALAAKRVAEYLRAAPEVLEEVHVAENADGRAMGEALDAMTRNGERRDLSKVRYVGTRERDVFARQAAAIRPELGNLVRFALGIDETMGEPRIGANRNALLLSSAGRVLVMSDDDMSPILREAPAIAERPAVSIADEARQLWLARSPDEALALAPVSPRHACDVAIDTLNSIDHGEISTLDDKVAGRASVVISFGLVGDIGIATPLLYLLQEGPSRERLVAAGYGSLRSHRDAVYAVDRPTVCSTRGLMAGAIAVRKESAVPPFFPFGTNEDGAYSVLLDRIDPRARVVRLPWLFVHRPPETRSFGPWRDLRRGPRICDLLMHALAESETGSLSSVAAHLKRCCGSGGEDLRDHLGGRWAAGIASLRERITSLLCRHRHMPPDWANDACDLLDALDVESQEDIVPRELRRCGGPEAWKRAREAFLLYADLLVAWPEIVAHRAPRFV
jgi:hypothetical protein